MKSFQIILLLSLIITSFAQEDELDNPDKTDKEEISSTKYIVLLIFIGMIIGMAQTGGIGGGQIVTPLITICWGVQSTFAMKFTYILMFFGGLGSFFRNHGQTYKNGPVIDYDLVLISLPMLMSGAVIGVLFNRMLPQLAIDIMLVILLYQVSKKTYLNWQKIKQKEKLQEQLLKAGEKEITKDEITFKRDQYPIAKIITFFLFSTFIAYFSFLKGGKQGSSIIGLDHCTIYYHLLNIILFLISVAIVIQIKRTILLNGECINIKENNINKMITSSLIAGTLGGMLGTGGGIILTPIWLGMGINPTQTSATSTFTVLFTSFASFIQVITTGFYKPWDIPVFGFTGLFGSLVIGSVLKYLTQKTGKQSIVLLVLLIAMIISLVLRPIMIVIQVIEDFGEQLVFHAIC